MTAEDETATSKGPQYTLLGGVKDGELAASLVRRGSDGRGKPRVVLHVWGARYPHSLTAAQARELGAALIAGADALDAAAP